jgi:hypothetical protein
MGIDKHSENRRMARVVEERAGVGTTEIVSGWQAMLVDLSKPDETVYEARCHGYLSTPDTV